MAFSVATTQGAQRLRIWQARRSSRLALPVTRAGYRTIFGNDGGPEQIKLTEQLTITGLNARVWSPLLPLKMSPEAYTDLPILFYFPGFDGTGMGASCQFPTLMEAFDFMSFTIPLNDRTPFQELVETFTEYIEEIVGGNEKGRPVYLLGESFGALVALAVAARCPDLVDRLVLVNPATSFEESIWPIAGPIVEQIPNELFPGIVAAIVPLMGNPITMVAKKIDQTQSLNDQLNAAFEGILEMFGTVGFINDVFTTDHAKWKLSLVREGFAFVNPLIPKIRQRTLLLVSEGDWLLPSGGEKNRLPNRMQRCRVRSYGMRSHALLQEVGIDLVKILKEEGFYVTRRQFSSTKETKPPINRFGTGFPIEMPTPIEIEKSGSSFSSLDRFVSSVYFTTTSEGRILKGLDAIPQDRPLLIVGNHQINPVDSFLVVERVLRERNILLRALAHPLLSSNENEETDNVLFFPLGRRETYKLLSTYGSVPVSPRSFNRLLQQGESILLYPGGIREAFKKKDELYQLFWPEKSEFVRTAAKHNATIVTLASVGLDETWEIILDQEDVLKTPLLKDIAQRQIQLTREALPGISTSIGDVFVPPLALPKIPKRLYFLFGKPFKTTKEHYEDKDVSQELYEEIREQLEKNISYLLEKSKEDPYGDFLKRFLYENTNGNDQAPTFIP